MGFLNKIGEILNGLIKKEKVFNKELQEIKDSYARDCREFSDEQLKRQYRNYGSSLSIRDKAKQLACKEELEGRGLM